LGALKAAVCFFALPAYIPPAAWPPFAKTVPASFCRHELLRLLVDRRLPGPYSDLTLF